MRRSPLAGWPSLLAALVVVVATGAVGPAPATAQTASSPEQSSGPSSWHGGPLHDGHSRDAAVQPPLEVAWQVGPLRTSHAVVGRERAFVLQGTSSGDGLTALDLATGDRLWGPLLRAGDPVVGHAYDAGRVFSMSRDGVLRAHGETDGRELWSVALDGSYGAPITAAFGSVYVAGGGGGRLHAVDAATGEVQWSSPVLGGSSSAPVVTDATVFVTSGCGVAEALRRADGTALWTRRTTCSGGGGRTASWHEGKLYVRDGSYSAVLDAETGAQVGDLRAAQIPAFSPGVGFFLEGPALTARDTGSGAVLWTRSVAAGLTTAPHVVDGHVYVGGADGLYAFRESDGRQVWYGDVPVAPAGEGFGSTWYPGVAASGGTLLVSGQSTLTALRPAGASAPPSAAPPPPAPDDDRPPAPADPPAPPTEVTAWQGGPLHAGHTSGERFAPPLSRVWQAPVLGSSHALVAAGRAFVVSTTGPQSSSLLPPGNELQALDVASGQLLWGPVPLGGTGSAADHAYGGGRVVTVNGSGQVRAHDAGTGAALWTVESGDRGDRGSTVVAAGDDVVLQLSGATSSTVLVLDGATGAERWSAPGAAQSRSAPVVTVDTVFVSSFCRTLAYRRDDGEPRWTNDTGCSGGAETPSLHGDRLYVRDGHDTRVLDTTSGADVGRLRGGEPAAFVGDVAYVLEAGTLTARSLSSGQPLWRRAGDGDLLTPPYVAAGHVYVGGRGQQLYAFRASDGVEVWRGPAPVDRAWEGDGRSPLDGITVAEGTVFVSGGDTLTAFRGVPSAPVDEPIVEPVPFPGLPPLPVPLPSVPPLPTPLPVPTPSATPTAPAVVPTTRPSPTASPSPSPSASPSPEPGSGRAVPRARDTADACPPGEVPPAGFRDLPPDGTHSRNVECLVWWGVARGRSPDSYAPADPVNRGQMATFVAKAIVESGGSLPATPPDAFRDDDGSVHEQAIDRLAAVGVVAGRADGSYGPGEPVRRDAMAKFLVLAYEHRAQTRLAARGDYFADDDGTTHEANIDKAAEVGFTGGSGDGSYRPAEVVRRDQMGSFLARVLDLSVEDAGGRPPSRR